MALTYWYKSLSMLKVFLLKGNNNHLGFRDQSDLLLCPCDFVVESFKLVQLNFK